MKRFVCVILSLFLVNSGYCEPEPEPSYGVPNILSHQPNSIEGLQQQQQQQSGFLQMYRSDMKFMNQMTTPEPSLYHSASQHSQYHSQTAYSQQSAPTYQPPQPTNKAQTTFEIQPSYGYDLGSVHQQDPNQQQAQLPVGHDIYGSPAQNQQQELSTGESLLHPQSTPYYAAHSNQYIPPLPSSVAPPSPPAVHQELPLAPTSYPSQPIFNPQAVSNDIPSPLSSGLSAPLPPPSSAPSALPSAPPAHSTLYDDNSYQPTGYDSTDGYYPPAKQTVHKHIYVHLPPKEFDEAAPRQHFKVPRAEKHYKIIFIKTPTPPQPQPVVPQLPQNEEKTLIYVLHKKPEEPEDIQIRAPEPTQPSKPEVYFIKYKTQNNLPALYGAPTAPTEEDASASAGEHSYPPAGDSQGVEPRNESNGNVDISNNLYNSTISNLHRFF